MSEPRRAQCRSCGAWITFGTKDGKFIPLERVELFTLKEYQDPREERPRYEMIPKGPETLYMSHGDRCPARRQGPPADRQPQQPQQRRLPATGRRDDDVPF